MKNNNKHWAGKYVILQSTTIGRVVSVEADRATIDIGSYAGNITASLRDLKIVANSRDIPNIIVVTPEKPTVSNILSDLGLNVSLKGFDVLVSAINIRLDNPTWSYMNIYAEAGKLSDITPCAAERRIRYVLHDASKHLYDAYDINMGLLHDIFGNRYKYVEDIPAASFIHGVALYIYKQGKV